MRFHLGPIPENPMFLPEEHGWRSLKEPTPWVAQLLAMPVGVAVLGGALLAWRSLIPAEMLNGTVKAAVQLFLPAFLAVVPVHEYIHAKCHPFNGSSPATVFGFWPAKVLFYAHYDDEMSRNRFLLILLAPFLSLTIGPLAVCAIASVAPPFVVSFTTVNGLAASLDLIGVALIALQLPGSAIVRNKGYRTWWRMSSRGHR
jgi:hypothetical protein